jgi:uncharacterized protein (TIGR02453 family)
MWPPEALEFLRELEDNNDRDWFRANRERYDAHLLEPTRALADSLRHLGEPRFFRPYNDTRFHARPPIKEQLGMAIGYGAGGGYYVELSLDGLLVGAGLHHPSAPQLDAFRRALDDGRRAAAFERALARSELELVEPELKRAPKGWSPDHPRIERLRLKNLTVFRRHNLGRWLHTAECDKRVRGELESSRPLVEWLRGTVSRAASA